MNERSINKEQIETFKVNTFRTFTDDEELIRLEFGNGIRNKEGKIEKVKTISSMQINPELTLHLVERLLLLLVMYQEEHDVDLGLKSKVKINKKSKGGE